MRAVADTNMLVRTLIKSQGTVRPVLHCLQEGTYRLRYAESLLVELVDGLGWPRIRGKNGLGDWRYRLVQPQLRCPRKGLPSESWFTPGC